MIESEKQKEFMELYHKYRDNIWRYCLFLCRNRELAKDLLSDTLLDVWSNFNRIRNNDYFLSYLFTTASRKYFKQKNIQKFELMDFDQLFSSDLNQETKTDISILYEALNKLPEYYRDTLLLSEIEGFSREEISKIHQVKPETVKSRLSRGKKLLSELLGGGKND